MPDDDQDGSADRHDGAPLATSAGDPPVAFPKEGIGLAGGDGGLAEHPSQLRVAVPGRPAALGFAGRLLDAGGELGPRDQCPAVGNRVMSTPSSASSSCAASWPTPGISSSRSTAATNGAISSASLASSSARSASSASTRASILASKKACWSVK